MLMLQPLPSNETGWSTQHSRQRENTDYIILLASNQPSNNNNNNNNNSSYRQERSTVVKAPIASTSTLTSTTTVVAGAMGVMPADVAAHRCVAAAAAPDVVVRVSI
jgi:hypothetical protein